MSDWRIDNPLREDVIYSDAVKIIEQVSKFADIDKEISNPGERILYKTIRKVMRDVYDESAKVCQLKTELSGSELRLNSLRGELASLINLWSIEASKAEEDDAPNE